MAGPVEGNYGEIKVAIARANTTDQRRRESVSEHTFRLDTEVLEGIIMQV